MSGLLISGPLNKVSTGESLLTSLFTFLLITHRSRGRIYELNAKVERVD